MKHMKYKSKSKHEKKKSKRDKKKHKKEKYSESETTTSMSETEQEWVEKPISQTAPSAAKEQNTQQSEAPKREDWMSMKSLFPCVFNEKKTKPPGENDKPNLDELGQSNRELNPYWKNGGSGLPEENVRKADTLQVMDVKWLKKSLRRAKEQAENENRSLEEIAAERWGSLEVIQSMISKAESASIRDKSNSSHQFKGDVKYGDSRHSSDSSRSTKYSRNDKYKKYDDYRSNDRQKQKYRKPMDDDCFDSSYRTSHSGRKNWQKCKPAESHRNVSESKNSYTSSSGSISTDVPEIRETHSNAPTARSPTNSTSNLTTSIPEIGGSKLLTEAEMNKLGAKIAKAEIMGDNELADELKSRLKNAREAAKNNETRGTEKVQVVLTQTDAKGNTRPLEPRDRTEYSQSSKRKNAETHASGKKVRHYFDDDKYSLAQLFQKEKGRSANEDDAEFLKVASKTMDMDEIFEERITRVKSDARQDERDRSRAIKEHTRLSKSLDNCQWCIDSKYMLKHMVVTMDRDICISLPQFTSLTPGHCIITPTHHVSCQLQLDENVSAKLKMYKQALYKMFTDQDQYPVFYEVYKSRYKYSHMQLICVPLAKEIGELAPIYFKKALLECETEWSMNKKVVDLEHKDVRQAIPNGLSYFMVEFERDKGYAHVIEDEQMFPKNFAEEVIGGMLDLNHDTWRRPRKEDFDRQREKVLRFSETWKKYEDETRGFN
ncbi:CWF19-like protein 2 [Ceratina calcarata]|uniref:CWF19-like protein 2 n=1 Tax=Ceratina calcarata TaxID=156304 RepID=A0AAJ7ND30_9HYME|nr:CWF19-like protein 2 [Ceratina calcarata]